ncbi:type II toxin-antitoxin system RelE/ParE family toxin [Sphingomonas qomolangmaensis]|uniref:Type II toxin-antitoxin system RelE/ParE family toxin n=1 Tax=Sphingomonas qomolangmaensis TaxID=2918765 RepID=A0ABY5L7E5_9SPHN|nr:type II toxin-antitoxin system RelE/ParE family toxin [Sphingomonas qomolangmaensis]UUL82885.1 type II toxin-antitoxin system RelE/ParE family toxin [Sphingomonas qomolangmaensis]
MAIVSWSIAASVELQAIIDFIDLSDSPAADRLGRRLAAAARSLDTFPNRGCEIAPGIRQLSVVYPYLIRYRVAGDRFEILSVRHGARDEDG